MEKPPAKVYPVKTRFQQMASRPGGISRDAAISVAESAVEQLKPGFDDWLGSELQALTDAVARLGGSGATNLEYFTDALVHCCAIHDVGATMGRELISFVTEGLRDILQASMGGAEYRANRVGCFMEALALANQPPYRDLAPNDLPDLAEGLRALAAYAVPAAASPAKAARS